MAAQRAGFDVRYQSSDAFSGSRHYEKAKGAPQPGDVMWQPGHVGIYTGQMYKNTSIPQGLDIGSTRGVRESPWGEDADWFEGGDELTYYPPVRTITVSLCRKRMG